MSLAALVAAFVRRHWRAYSASAVMLAGIAILTVWVPRRVAAIIDRLVHGQVTPSALLGEFAILVAMGLTIYVLRVGWRLALFSAAYQLGVELRTKLYRQFTLQGARFFQGSRTGDLMARATNDIDAVELTVGEALLAGFDGTMTLILVVAMMTLGIDWRLGLAALLPFPFMAFAFWRISRHVHHAWRDSLARFGKLNDHVQETLAGVRTVRALGLEARSSAHFAELTAAAAKAGDTAQRWEAAYEPAVGLALSAASALTLSLGGWLVWQGELTIGLLTGFSMYLGQLIWPMFAAGHVLSLIERGRAAWERLQPVLEAAPEMPDHGTLAAPAGDAALELAEVTYRFPGQTAPALDAVNLRLEAGHTLGLVGATGAGKSTLIRLLLRQDVAESGALRWGGRPLADYSLDALRAAMAWVPQEAFLFSASIADNIALAKPDASRTEIEQAARLAAIHDDILRLPKGYETPVGERGVSLSGGQRQRVAIARALLSDAPILLLDDALSAVDTETETRILSHLRDARRGRTVIIVSHRLSAVMDAEHTLVLRHGRVIEAGTHAELLERNGWYASQWRYQQLEASLNAA